MHVKAKRMAFAGLMLALTVLCMFLGSVIETNTLFLLAAASYFVGAVIREAGIRFGAAFYIAAVISGFMAAPNKFYVISFAAMGLYILIFELSSYPAAKIKNPVRRTALLWTIKYLAFNLMFLPVLFKFQQAIFGKTLSHTVLPAAVLAGQAGIYIFDRAYVYFRRNIWDKIRKLTIG